MRFPIMRSRGGSAATTSATGPEFRIWDSDSGRPPIWTAAVHCEPGYEAVPRRKAGNVYGYRKLTKKDMEEEFFYVGLRMTAGVSLSEFERRFRDLRKGSLPGLMETFVKEKAAHFERRPLCTD